MCFVDARKGGGAVGLHPKKVPPTRKNGLEPKKVPHSTEWPLGIGLRPRFPAWKRCLSPNFGLKTLFLAGNRRNWPPKTASGANISPILSFFQPNVAGFANIAANRQNLAVSRLNFGHSVGGPTRMAGIGWVRRFDGSGSGPSTWPLADCGWIRGPASIRV